jgi:hypothetical protein
MVVSPKVVAVNNAMINMAKLWGFGDVWDKLW